MRVHITKANHGKPWYLRSQISHLEVHTNTHGVNGNDYKIRSTVCGSDHNSKFSVVIRPVSKQRLLKRTRSTL